MLSLKGHVPHTDIPGWDPRAPQMTGRGRWRDHLLMGPHIKFGTNLMPLTSSSVAHKFNNFIYKNNCPLIQLSYPFGWVPGLVTIKGVPVWWLVRIGDRWGSICYLTQEYLAMSMYRNGCQLPSL